MPSLVLSVCTWKLDDQREKNQQEHSTILSWKIQESLPSYLAFIINNKYPGYC